MIEGAAVRVMGVDPGLTRCGVGVVEGAPGKRLHLVHVSVVRTDADEDHALRLVGVEAGIEALVEEFRPDAVAVERVFSQHNVRTVMGTAQAAGIAMLVAARRGLPVALHTPSEAKAAVTGNGRADKAQVTRMVTRLLSLETAPRPADAADALALAICHVWRGGAQQRLAHARRSRIEDAARAERARLAARSRGGSAQ
ncbi:crossover junction endodeoxyribonuclease RuvC [Actinomadura sp. BRA 177]|uniref:crossover junction endodeoxyribonuclease RuvC n=1 Tax=Actinomadura sp. BRA 177 TaxID=2745202 RepID=UPI0020CEA629|nr:crossover junction endodeoxyribonuclease RuvC [Actinomadura sp. BRA 177]